MTQKNMLAGAIPPEISEEIIQIGAHISLARKRRSLTMDEMASRMFVSRKTLSRLEKGESGVSLAVLASALWVLGLEKDLQAIAAPEKDSIGIFHERKKLPKRIRTVQVTRQDKLDF